MTLIPGTLQGDFPVCFVEIDELDSRVGRWKYKVGNNWKDFPLDISQEFRIENNKGFCCGVERTIWNVKYTIDFTTNMASIDGKVVEAKYVETS